MLAIAAARGRYRGQAGRTDSNAHRHTHTHTCAARVRHALPVLTSTQPLQHIELELFRGKARGLRQRGEDEGLNSKKMHTNEREVSKGNERKENEPKQRFGYSAERRDGQIQEATGPERVSSDSLSVGPKQSP